ncbi:MAG: CapA family protein [Pyrinomonadaceae bacterium]|nr:CapA family protein [Pyrinomonadaceae bacterium]
MSPRRVLQFVIVISAICISGCAAESAQGTRPLFGVAEAAETPTPSPTPGTTTISIAAVGDIMLGSPYPKNDRMPPNDGADILKGVTPIISAADIAFGNLEGPMTDSGESIKCKPKKPVEPQPIVPEDLGGKTKPEEPIRCFAFRMPTRYAKHLVAAGFDVLSLANNHSLDFGLQGIADTRKALETAGIMHAGSDRLKHSTTVLEVKGKRVAFVAFAHNTVVPNVNDLAAARQFVVNADKAADIVVVSFHGGAEGSAAQIVPNRTELYFGERRGNLPLFARTVIDAGADLVLGHGPHVLRGMEVYKGRLVAYSLGNFATYGWFKLKDETALTAILEVQLNPDGSFAGGKIHSGRQVDWGVPAIDESGTALRKIKALSITNFSKTTPIISDDGSLSPRK